MAENKISVDLIGKDRSLAKSLQNAGKDAHTFSGRLRLVGDAIKNLLHGNFKAAGQSLKTLMSGFGGLGVAAGIAAAAIGVALAVIVRQLKQCVNAYVEWGKVNIKVERLTGITGQAVAELTTQWRLSGLESGKATKGVQLFSRKTYEAFLAVRKADNVLGNLNKNTDDYTTKLAKAEAGLRKAQGPFRDLGVQLRDANGKLRPMGDLLADVREAFSKLEPGPRRTALAMQLFGKSGADLLPWLTKSQKEIDHYNKLLADMGLSWGGKQLTDLKTFIAAQREMSFVWDVAKTKISQALIPLINQFLPQIAAWMPKAFNWLQQQGPGIWSVIKQIGGVLGDVWGVLVKVGGAVKTVVEKFIDFAQAHPTLMKVLGWIGLMAQPLVRVYALAIRFKDSLIKVGQVVWGALVSTVNAVRSAINHVVSAAKTVWGWLKKVGNMALGGIVGAIQGVVRALQWIVDKAREAYEWLQKVLGAQTNSRGGATGGKGYKGGSKDLNPIKFAPVFIPSVVPVGEGSGGSAGSTSIVFEGDVYVRDEAELDAFASRILSTLAAATRSTNRTGVTIR